MKKYMFFMIVVLIAVLFVGCVPDPTMNSDQGFKIVKKVDEQVYNVRMRVGFFEDYQNSYSTLSGASLDGFGMLSGVSWTEGKGLIRGSLLSSSPEVSFVHRSQPLVVKTTDTKLKLVISGDVLNLYCTVDYEPVCQQGERLDDGTYATICEETWEFDYCRLKEIESEKEETQ